MNKIIEDSAEIALACLKCENETLRNENVRLKIEIDVLDEIVRSLSDPVPEMEVGSRVVVSKDSYTERLIGQIGVVRLMPGQDLTHAPDFALVQFEGHDDLHNGFSNAFMSDRKDCWWIAARHLELVEPFKQGDRFIDEDGDTGEILKINRSGDRAIVLYDHPMIQLVEGMKIAHLKHEPEWPAEDNMITVAAFVNGKLEATDEPVIIPGFGAFFKITPAPWYPTSDEGDPD